MGKLGIFMILLLLVAGVGFALNPSEKDHHEKIYTVLEKQASDKGIVGAIGVEIAKRTGALELTGIEYHSYMVFSMTKRKGEMVTLGVFGKIFVIDDDIISLK
ncbi:MAG: hypothetical protein HN350_17600 [Phycisphaerales bacterium]|jgi:hypothetical protein|nr:hypothetical protein [Phycisphaerales bacterium]